MVSATQIFKNIKLILHNFLCRAEINSLQQHKNNYRQLVPFVSQLPCIKNSIESSNNLNDSRLNVYLLNDTMTIEVKAGIVQDMSIVRGSL